MAKQRTKKYNPNKVKDYQINHLLRNYVLVMNLAITGKDIILFNTKHMKCYAPNKQTMYILEHERLNWSYVLAVYATEANGKERITPAYIKAPYACKQVEIYKSLNEAHSQLIAEEVAKGNNVHNAAWVAIPHDLGNLNDAEQEELCKKCLHYLEVYDG